MNTLNWNSQTQSWDNSYFSWSWTPNRENPIISLFMTIWDKHIDCIFEASIEKELFWVWITTIKIGIVDNIKKYERIKLYEVYSWWDVLVFDGYVYDLEVNTKSIIITWKHYKELLKNKLLLQDKNYNGWLKDSLEDILNIWNTETSDTLKLKTNFNNSLTKELKQWDNLYDILDELTWLFGLIWTIQDKDTIYINDMLWEDKTQIWNFFEAIYNNKDKWVNNLLNPRVSQLWDRYNIIIWKNQNLSIIKKESSDFPALGSTQTFRDWDLEKQTEEYLASRVWEQKIISFEINEPLNIWDKIKITIEETNSYLDFSWEAFVLNEKIEYINGARKTNIGVSNIYAYRDDFLEKWQQTNKNINLLKNNIW